MTQDVSSYGKTSDSGYTEQREIPLRGKERSLKIQKEEQKLSVHKMLQKSKPKE